MVEVKAVIGKNFGDEGKGQTVNLLCRGKNALVVRHNGGAQAGHTVEEKGFRFVFHQLGSGSLQGCPTYWCRTFLPDLLKLGEEINDFNHAANKCNTAGKASGYSSRIYADPRCACTTVYDVILNSLTERLRGRNKHGSCGMGIFEAVLRTKDPSFALRLYDFEDRDRDKIIKQLRHIRDDYTIPRLKALKNQFSYSNNFLQNNNADPWERLPRDRTEFSRFIQSEFNKWGQLITDENVLYNSAEIMCGNFNRYVTLADWPQMAGKYDTILFENGQGLLLDWDNEEYSPHLTASHTGLKNVAELLRDLDPECIDAKCKNNGKVLIDRNGKIDLTDISTSYTLEIVYVSRSYVTRHGAGRLDFECPKETINPEMTDRTNIPNPWQDNLRYAKHPAGEDFFRYIREDLKWLGLLHHPPFTATLCLTHLNETQGKVLFSDKSRDFEEFCRYCKGQAPGLFRVLPQECL